jgi:dolichol-phosphate mannosyltransferase
MKRLLASEKGLFLVVAAVGLWTCLTLPVFAQESYYWSYAQHPDLSYFDHPPMVAWLIWLGSSVFGDGALGIRIGTLLCSLGIALCGLRMLAAFGAGDAARRAWILLGIGVPGYAGLHFLSNPDPPLCAAWAASMLLLWRARDGGLGWWLCAGAAAGIALLSKYTAAFLAVGGVGVLLFDPLMRRQLRRPGPWLGVLTAAVVFSPVVIWNAIHHFESFRFQTGGRFEKAALGTRWLIQCVGGQFGMINPVLALLLVPMLAWLWRRARSGDVRTRWLLAFGVPLPATFLALSLVLQVKVNWFLPAFFPLCVGMLLWWTESGAMARWQSNVATWSAAVCAALLLLAPLWRFVPQSQGSNWYGWDRIAAAALQAQLKLDSEDGRTGNTFFFGSDYKDSAQLLRALTILGGGRPYAPVMAQNVFGEDALEFDHWEQPEAHVGESAVFVLPRADNRPNEVEDCGRVFGDVQRAQRVAIDFLGVHVLDADIYLCRQYRGPARRDGATPHGTPR